MSNAAARRRIVVGITGASGVAYGIRALDVLMQAGIETHLILSKAAELTMTYETDLKPADVKARASVCYASGDIGAAISSGSFRTMGMLIVPCSVRTMSEIATGVTGTLMSRAADVVLKERRRLVLGVRETPLHSGHLRTLLQLSDMGAVIAPLVPAFYSRPQSLEALVDHTVGRLLDLFDIETDIVKRWKQE
ncbi:MAG TPA: UbiX family flavin prenyltransferase [Paraburkholderia sp.]|jgi:4-hydroxy-3-polyprenylbenzoate decarboxylase|nr:UbiX family flavin prenyltransferase [Paraburkholderia sp.]